MSDETNTSPVATGASDYTPPSYEIDPADQHIADAILSQDPASLPGTMTATGPLEFAMPTKVEALPPHLRAKAEAKLQYVPDSKRVEAEAAAVAEVMRDNALDIRSKTGFAKSVDPVWNERADLVREYNSALNEFDRIAAQLTEVSHYEARPGPDGKSQPSPVYAVGAAARGPLVQRQAELLHKAALLFGADGTPGLEGKRRLDKALKDSVERRKGLQAALDDKREIEKRTAETLREERIQAAVAVRVRARRNDN